MSIDFRRLGRSAKKIKERLNKPPEEESLDVPEVEYTVISDELVGELKMVRLRKPQD